MRHQIILLAALASILAGCMSNATAPSTTISPREAVMLAADAAPSGIPGTFEMDVVATGAQNGMGFLNSQSDYRDQRNLTVAIAPRLRTAMTEMLGEDPILFYKGKRIIVRGQARRVTVFFFGKDGERTNKYYYQTHVQLQAPNDISLSTNDQ